MNIAIEITVWEYIFAGCMIAMGLLFGAIWLVDWIGKRRVREEALRNHVCKETMTIHGFNGKALGRACEECYDAKLVNYPDHVLMGDTRPVEER